jgi:hypothetical protein
MSRGSTPSLFSGPGSPPLSFFPFSNAVVARGLESIIKLNDHPGMTQADVLALLDEVGV